MGLESVTTIADLVATNPLATDDRSQGDDHIRNLKVAVRSLLATANLTNLAQIGFPASASGQAGKYLKVAAGEGALEYGALGGAAVLDVGTAAGTVAAGDDSRFVTNGNSHDHAGGDGAQISYANLSSVPMAQRAEVWNNPSAEIASGVDVLYPFNTEVLDTASFWSIGDPTKVYIPATGGYLFLAQLSWGVAFNAQQSYVFNVNAGLGNYGGLSTDKGFVEGQVSALISLTAGDYVRLRVTQLSGVSKYLCVRLKVVRLW